MNLASIPKHPVGKALSQAVTPLDHLDISALGRWWDGSASASDHDRVLALLDRLHTGSAWLACGCTGDRGNPPLLAVARRTAGHGGGLSLRRLMDRDAHRPDCRFVFEQREPADDDAQGADRGGADGVGEAVRPDFLFEQATRVRAPCAGDAPEREASESRSRAHPLARRMLWLLHEAGVNRWPKPYDSTDRGALLKLAETVELAQGLFLRDVLYCDPRAWRERWMEAGFSKCEAHGLKPQVWWLTEIEHASKKEGRVRLTGAEEDTVIDCRLAVYGGDDAAVRYPMLMCALVGKLPDGSVRITQAYAHPIQALDWWLPVDSDLERDAVQDLVVVMRWLHHDKGVDLEMLKPLFSWNGTGARPDFVVSHRGRPEDCVVIETMGSDDAEYRERKVRTMERLTGHELIEDERARDPANAGKLLKSCVAKWALNSPKGMF